MIINNLKIKILLCLVMFCRCAAGLTADLNADGIVNQYDLQILCEQWLDEPGNPSADFDNSNFVDFKDFIVLADEWQGALHALPDKAINLFPINESTGHLPNKVTLSWVYTDHVAYEVYFGETNPPPYITNIPINYYTPGLLKNNTTYYWRIDCENDYGTTTGDVWSFTTIANAPPRANDIAVSAITHIPKTITLQAVDDDNYPNSRLRYIITDLPTDINAKLGGTKSGEQSPIRESDLPYKLSSWGSQVVFATTTAGSTSFKYKVYDGNLYSAEKTVSITVTANPKDCLSFNGSGYVAIPDTGNCFDLEPNTGKALFIQTTQLACEDMLCKYQAGSPGWKMGIRNGRLRIKLYDAAGLAATIDSNTFISDGSWHHVGFVYDPNGYIEILESNEADFTAGNYQYTSTGQVPIPLQSYSNNSNLVVGNGFSGQIDNLRAYVAMDLPNIFYAYYGMICQNRATAGTANVWDVFTLHPGASARFYCDYDNVNNTITQIYDDISATLIGAFSSSENVKYLPYVWFYPLDAAAYQQVIR